MAARESAGRSSGVRLKWVAPENLHLTLAFLGETPSDTDLEGIKGSMDAAAGAFREIGITTGELGAFPSFERLRVLWLGIKNGAAGLKALASGLSGGLSERGFRSEREFTPHITLARAGKPLDGTALAAAAAPWSGAAGTISSMILFESRLLAGGPVYRAVYTAKLTPVDGGEHL
jgi:2'-5' RNA ligase